MVVTVAQKWRIMFQSCFMSCRMKCLFCNSFFCFSFVPLSYSFKFQGMLLPFSRAIIIYHWHWHWLIVLLCEDLLVSRECQKVLILFNRWTVWCENEKKKTWEHNGNGNGDKRQMITWILVNSDTSQCDNTPKREKLNIKHSLVQVCTVHCRFILILLKIKWTPKSVIKRMNDLNAIKKFHWHREYEIPMNLCGIKIN